MSVEYWNGGNKWLNDARSAVGARVGQSKNWRITTGIILPRALPY